MLARRFQPSLRRRGLTLAIREGAFAAVFVELTGGARQIGFALLLGARDLHIGLLSALPFLANLAQLASSYLLERTGQHKPLSLLVAGFSRLVWIGVILMSLGLVGTAGDVRVWVLVSIVGLSALFAAMNNTVWLAWLGDLVPSRLRGRYFGRRNMVIAGVGMTVSLLAGVLIDAWKRGFSPQSPGGFLIVFAVGVVSGALALWTLWRMPTPPFVVRNATVFFSRLAIPLRDDNFRRFILFHVCWNFGVYVASPFVVVYMLKDLGLSYTMVTLLASTTAVCNMLGMRFWGVLTDRFSAKPVSLLGCIAATLLPGLWLLTPVVPLWLILPALHMLGGFGWSAIDLTTNTLLLALAPRQERSIYLSVYASLIGLMAAIAQIMGGLAAKMLSDGALPVVPQHVSPYLPIFALSCVLRGLSLPLSRRVREPREVPVERLLPIFGNLRTLNTMMGFESLFQFTYMQGERLDTFLVARGSSLRQTLERLDQATDAYAAAAEGEIKDILKGGEAALKRAQVRGDSIERRLDAYVTHIEARMASWMERLISRLAAWWQRHIRQR